jgi:cell division protein FtsW
MDKIKGHIDWYILLPISALMLFGLSFVYSASSAYSGLKLDSNEALFFSHLGKVILGLILMIVFAKIDYHVYRKISKSFLTISVLLLVMVLFIGSSAKGATRWIDLGPISLQPSEIVKFAMVIHFASMLSAKQAFIKQFEQGFLPFLIWLGLISILIALQPNFSTMIVVLLIGYAIMFIGNVNLLHWIGTLLIGIFAAGLYLISAPYRMKRILSYLGMGDATSAAGSDYQLNQALIAIGNGGITGLGPGQSRQSNLFLPESYGDFIFSIVGEEFGFIGLVLILAAFGLVFWRGLIVAKNAPDNFGYFLSVGIIITFAFYVFVNAGVNTGILPTTGVPFPFISYGGTAILLYSAAIGILLNISAQTGMYPIIANQSLDDSLEEEEDDDDDDDD